LPEEIHQDKIQASYTDGILKLSLPKKEEFIQLPAKSITVR
jgi:HSP20 family protein